MNLKFEEFQKSNITSKELDAIRRKFYLLADITIKNHLTTTDTFAEFRKKHTEYYEKYNSN